MENVKFSIIIAAYNIENYIERSIKSVLSQSYKNYELIVVDDYSTDNTRSKIEKYKDDIIFIKHKKNTFLGGTRNTGIEAAKGKYILFLDGDDFLYDDNVLEKLDNLIGDKTVDVIYMGFNMIGKKKGLIIPRYENCAKEYRIAGDRYTNAWSKCWRRQFLLDNNLRFPENRYYEDVLFIYNAIMKSNSFLIADFPVHTYYSGRPNSITSNIRFKNIHDNIDNIEDLIKMMQEDPNDTIKLKIKKEAIRCKERLDELLAKYDIKIDI